MLLTTATPGDGDEEKEEMECAHCESIFPSSIYHFYNKGNFQTCTPEVISDYDYIVLKFSFCGFMHLPNFLKLKHVIFTVIKSSKHYRSFSFTHEKVKHEQT